MDEYAYTCACDKCRALFKERYGGELMPGLDGDPTNQDHANSALFRMEVITELARDVSAAIHGHSPATNVYSVVNLKGLTKLWRVSDLEEHSRHFDLGGVDLYGAHGYYRSVLMFARGAFGNVKRVENCVGYAAGKQLERQLDLTTMYGASTYFFGMSSTLAEDPERVTRIAGPYFCWQKFSGYARLMGGMQPVRHVALLRDRSLLIESIKHREANKETFVTERGLYALANLKNVQMDMVFSRFFKPEALQGYRLLLVPDNKRLSESTAETIRQFAEGGGCVYVEGESCKANRVTTGLCAGGEKLAEIGGLKLFKRGLGKGAVLYTHGFLSEKLPRDKPLATRFRELLLEQAAPAPLAVEPIDAEGLDAVLYSDGTRYMLNVLNESPVLRHEVTFSLNAPIGKPAIWVDMATGASGGFDGSITCTVEPGSPRFLLFTPKAAFSVPRSECAEQRLGCYAGRTGMDFLRTRAAEDDGGAGRARRVRGMINVAVFVHPKMGHDKPGTLKGQLGVKEGLGKAAKDMVVSPIEDLADLEELDRFDVVIVPNIRKANPPAGWEGAVRKFVLAGGGALLIHHAVGYGSGSGVMFPELGRGVDYTPEVDMRVVVDHPVTTGAGLVNGVTGLKTGAEFVSGFPDYITISPGRDAQVLIKSLRGRTDDPEAVVVAGQVGKGKVILCGMNIGCQGAKKDGKWEFRAEVKSPGEREILLNAVRWLAQVRPAQP